MKQGRRPQVMATSTTVTGHGYGDGTPRFPKNARRCILDLGMIRKTYSIEIIMPVDGSHGTSAILEGFQQNFGKSGGGGKAHAGLMPVTILVHFTLLALLRTKKHENWCVVT